MFNNGRSMGFMHDDFPEKRGGFKVTLEIEEDDKHDGHDFDNKPTAEWFKEKVSHMLMPLIDMWEAEVDVKWEKETIAIWDWTITRPVFEPVIEEIDLIPVIE